MTRLYIVNLIEQRRVNLPYSALNLHFLAVLGQVWHFLYPNCLLKKRQNPQSEENFHLWFKNYFPIDVHHWYVDLVLFECSSVLSYTLDTFSVPLLLLQKKSNTFTVTCLIYTNLLQNTTIKDRHTWKSFSGERWTLSKTYSWFLNAIVMEIRVWSRCVEW